VKNTIQVLLVIMISFFLMSCGGSDSYGVGVFNNTKHAPVKIKIQYPSPDGIKRIRFSMINVGEFKSNGFNTQHNPVPPETKLSWENSAGDVRSAVLDLSFVPMDQNDGAIIFDIDEYDATVRYLDKEQFSGEWEERLVRKGYK
jgi:hypothetical protein